MKRKLRHLRKLFHFKLVLIEKELIKRRLIFPTHVWDFISLERKEFFKKINLVIKSIKEIEDDK